MFAAFTHGAVLLGVAALAMALGWFAASLRAHGRAKQAVAQCKARVEAHYARQLQRLRDSNIDLENHVRDLADRLERREIMMRDTQVADVAALNMELRQAREEINRLRAGGAAISRPPVSTPLRPSAFQDFLAEPQTPAAKTTVAQPGTPGPQAKPASAPPRAPQASSRPPRQAAS